MRDGSLVSRLLTGVLVTGVALSLSACTPKQETVQDGGTAVASADEGDILTNGEAGETELTSSADEYEVKHLDIEGLQDEVHYGLTKDSATYTSLFEQGYHKPGHEGVTDNAMLDKDAVGLPYMKNDTDKLEYDFMGALVHSEYNYIYSIYMGKDRLEVETVKDGSQYEERNPYDTKSPDEYFWLLSYDGNYITHLMEAPAYMLTEHPELQSVKYTVYLDGKTYVLDKTRTELEEYFGVTFDNAFQEDFLDTFGYPVAENKEEMQKFLDTMVTVS